MGWVCGVYVNFCSFAVASKHHISGVQFASISESSSTAILEGITSRLYHANEAIAKPVTVMPRGAKAASLRRSCHESSRFCQKFHGNAELKNAFENFVMITEKLPCSMDYG